MYPVNYSGHLKSIDDRMLKRNGKERKIIGKKTQSEHYMQVHLIKKN